MLVPIRIQRSRKAGSTTPANTKYCGRPGKWGNPFSVHQITHTPDYFRVSVNTPDKDLKSVCVSILQMSGPAGFNKKHDAAQYAAHLFAALMVALTNRYPVEELRQYAHLSCWCKIGEPCHVDEIIKRLHHLLDAGKTISE